MKKLLALATLALLLGGCGTNETVEDDNNLIDMMGNESVEDEDTDTVEPEEEPYSVGPSEIPSDLVPNDAE